MTPHELKKLRKDAGMTQEDLAKRLGVSVYTVVNWERRNASVPQIAEIAIRKVTEGRCGRGK